MSRDVTREVKEYVSQDLATWLKVYRNAYVLSGDHVQALVIDILLDEVRDAGVEGYLPWDRGWRR